VKREYSVAEAKARFADCLRAAEHGEPTVITRHGRRVAALVSADEIERLERLRAAGPEGGLASIAGGWEGSERLAKILDEQVARRTRRSRR